MNDNDILLARIVELVNIYHSHKDQSIRKRAIADLCSYGNVSKNMAAKFLSSVRPNRPSLLERLGVLRP